MEINQLSVSAKLGEQARRLLQPDLTKLSPSRLFSFVSAFFFFFLNRITIK